MADEISFHQLIAARPDDDGPRLLYADYLDERGDPASIGRAEFIRVQCALAAAASNDEIVPLLARERQLLTKHWPTWLKPACQALAEPSPLAGDRYQLKWHVLPGRPVHAIHQSWSGGQDIPYLHSVQFRRGFLAHAALVHKSHRSKSHVVRLWDRAPLDGLTLMQYPPNEVRATLSAIDATRMRSLELGFTDVASVAFLGQLPDLGGARELVLRAVTGAADVAELLSRSGLLNLKRLFLYRCPINTEGLARLLRSSAGVNLKELELVGCGLQSTAHDALCGDYPMAEQLHVSIGEDRVSPTSRRRFTAKFGERLHLGVGERNWPGRYFMDG